MPDQELHPPIIAGGGFPAAAMGADRRPCLMVRVQMVLEAGRDPAAMPIPLFGGTEDTDLFKRYRDAGVGRLVTTLPPSQLTRHRRRSTAGLP